MISFAQRVDLSEQTQSLLTVIHGEAMLGCLDSTKSHCIVPVERQVTCDSTEDAGVEDASAAKRLRLSEQSEMLDDTAVQRHPVKNDTGSPCHSAQDTSATEYQHSSLVVTTEPVTSSFSRCPMFYYCLHRRRLKNVNLPK